MRPVLIIMLRAELRERGALAARENGSQVARVGSQYEGGVGLGSSSGHLVAGGERGTTPPDCFAPIKSTQHRVRRIMRSRFAQPLPSPLLSR